MNNQTSKWMLLGILLFSLCTRLYQLSLPASYYFDEVYHAVTAKAYANNDPRGYEWWHPAPEPNTAFEWLHPPIAKLFMATGIKLLGANPFAWRLPGVLFGVLSVYLTYLLAFQITKKSTVAILAGLLASLDGLLLSQSRIAMNDIYVTAWMVLSILTYLKWLEHKKNHHLMWLSIWVGCAIATKWSGVFLIPIIGVIEGIMLAKKKASWSFNRYAKLTITLIFIPGLIYFFSYGQFFLQGHTFKQFRDLHQQILWYQFNLDATHPYQSPAWQWPLLIKPVWQSVDYSAPGKVGNIYAMSNPIISWLGLIAVVWLVYKLMCDKKFQNPHYGLLATSYFAVWLPWVFSPRIMFYYHYTPAIPFLCIILAIFLSRIYKKSSAGQSIAVNAVGVIVIAFILFYPHWVGILIPKAYSDWLFWLPSWR